MYLIGDSTVEERKHAEECAACQAKIASLTLPLSGFRGAVRTWSDQLSARDRAAELRWTVIPASDRVGPGTEASERNRGSMAETGPGRQDRPPGQPPGPGGAMVSSLGSTAGERRRCERSGHGSGRG